jgi:hypothetical protein
MPDIRASKRAIVLCYTLPITSYSKNAFLAVTLFHGVQLGAQSCKDQSTQKNNISTQYIPTDLCAKAQTLILLLNELKNVTHQVPCNIFNTVTDFLSTLKETSPVFHLCHNIF